MKKLLIYIVALVVGSMTLNEVNAQGRGRGHGDKHRKEYTKSRHQGHKAAHYGRDRNQPHREYRRESYNSHREYYRERDNAYRGYIKRHNKRYRDHDRWYYDQRFYRRSEYVYFPAYRTYYDPYRRGYIYRRNNAWVFAPTMPSVMVGLNLGSVNVQFMANLPL
ncbi:hypothetical protein [Parapedobacter sp. DT-150]|uniref:hypothetical protein n=1 Tax=Parapedobacter sp. DT-150 TaxID=3396162 RepID=UPI003F1CA36F